MRYMPIKSALETRVATADVYKTGYSFVKTTFVIVIRLFWSIIVQKAHSMSTDLSGHHDHDSTHNHR